MNLGALPLSAIDSPAGPATAALTSFAMGALEDAGIAFPRELAPEPLPSMEPREGMWDELKQRTKQAENNRER